MDSQADAEYPPAPATGQKRKGSTLDAATPVKHRSSKACQSCRARKVRCDVIRSDSECTNCRLDGLKCVVLPSRRGRSTRNKQHINAGVTSSRVDDSTRNSSTFVTEHETVQEPWENASLPVAPSDASQVPVCVTFDEDDNGVVGEQHSAGGLARNPADVDPADAYSGLLTPSAGPNTASGYVDGERPALPRFIAPLSNHLTREDIDYLVRKGATTVPEPDLQAEILQGYLFSVHPFMPMLDFRPFIDAVLNISSHHQISLLLFQAVMFAGLHSLPLHVIQRLGFETTKQARKAFFDRVKLLYEFDVELEDAAILQSLILMSSWYNRWRDRRHTWHWTGLAFDIARNMGLHRDPAIRYSMDEVQRFRRRLWWSLYIRDRMIALGTRRPMRIRDDECNVAMLTLEDFDLGHEQEFSKSIPLMPTVEENTSTALMCIQLAKLCVCIGDVTSSQYTTLSRNPDVPHTMMIVSEQVEDRNEELERCDKELNDWFEALEKNVRRDGYSSDAEHPQSCSAVHWAMLKIAYLTTVNVLHRGRALKSLSKLNDVRTAQDSSRAKVKDAARRITKDSQTMLVQDQVRFFGLLGVTALVAASLSHLLDLSSADEDVRDASTLRLYQSLQILQYLRSIYASADAAVSFLASVTRTAGISIPAQITAPSVDFASATENGLVQRGKHSADLAETEASHARTLSSATEASLPFNQHQGYQRSHLAREPYIEALRRSSTLGPDASVGSVGSAELEAATPHQASMFALQTSDMARPITMANIAQFTEPTPGELVNSSLEDPIFTWNHGIEANMGLFNYDFYSNASGFSDGSFQDI